MSFKVSYAGYDITEYISVTSLDRGLLPEVDQDLRKTGRSDGYNHFSSSIGKKVIPMGFILKWDLIVKRRRLANILMKRTPQPLIFSDEPNIEWYAIADGDIGVDEENFIGRGTINWIVPDGIGHSINPKYFTNIKPGTANENLVLDPEFTKKNKYWKSWSVLLNETHLNSNILRGDFSTPSVIANDPTFGNWFQVNQASCRFIDGIKVGDAFSASIDVRIIKATDSQASSSTLVIEEKSDLNGQLLKRHIVRADETKIGEWQTIKLINAKVENPATKVLNLCPSCYDGAIVDISRPILNLGPTVMPYQVMDAQLSDSVNVISNGTYLSYPILRARMNGENGLVAFVNNDGGVLQFGNPEELDVKEGKRSDKVLNIQMRNNSSYFTINGGGVSTYPNYVGDESRPNIINGDVSWTKNAEGMAPVWVTDPTAKAWNGPRARILTIPRNSANKSNGDFKFENRIDFKTDKKKSGRMEFVVGSNDKYIMAMIIRDSSSTKDELIVEFWATTGIVKSITINRSKFTGSYFSVNLSRIGSKLEFKFGRPTSVVKDEVLKESYQETLSLTCPESFELPVTELSCWFQRFKTSEVVEMYWWDSKFTWLNEPTYTNIPNLFDDGDIVEVDVKNRRVYVNGVVDYKLHALGNNWTDFAIETGSETIVPIASSWANMFEFEIELKESFI